MSKSDNLKLSIVVDGAQLYFGAPVFYNSKEDGDGTTLIINTEVGTKTKQKIEITLKQVTYVEPIIDGTSGQST